MYLEINMSTKLSTLYASILVMLMVTMGGCSAKHQSMKPTISETVTHTEHSDSLHNFFDSNINAHTPKSGFYPLHKNLDAFAARIAFIQSAKKSLDLQYYLFIGDNTGLTMIKYVLDAADRGVKVRIILDDILQGSGDKYLMALESHPNISIKLFNPTNFRSSLRWIEMFLHIDTMGRRMHNKVFIADNSVAVIGGRNIEDIYFSADKSNAFVDNDVLVAGPLVADISNEFETYWRSNVCIDITKVSNRSNQSLKTLRKDLADVVESLKYTDYIKAVLQSEFTQKFKARKINLIYGESQLYFDLPTKVTTSEDDTDTHLSEHLRPIILGATKRLWIVSPYYMPNPNSMKALEKLRQKGVDVAILTNSLATNDAIPVYSAYSKYQKALLHMGVRVYELSPHAYSRIYKNEKYKKGSIPRSSLHSKSMIIDDDMFIIGSANMDPRSSKLNTELVAVIKSKKMVDLQKELFKDVISPENSYQLTLEPASKQEPVIAGMPIEKERVVWHGIVNKKPVKYYNDGDAGFWRRLGSGIVSFFPVEGYM